MACYLSRELPGTGGSLRTEPEDFQVWELPAYEPSGAGPHLYLEVTKRDLTTPELVRRLARAMDVRPDDVGYAGLKDRHAVTTQRLSVPENARLDGLEDIDGVLEARVLGRHHNKLRRGHARGNRFRLRVRGTRALDRAQAVADYLRAHGWANFFGSQRFGREGGNWEVGLAGLRAGRMKLPGWKRGLMVSSVQAGLFNQWLEERIAAGRFETVLAGDLCGFLPAGGLFRATDPEAETHRVLRFETSVTGPIFGFKMMRPEGAPEAAEQAVLAQHGLQLEQFRAFRSPGSRRRMRLALPPLELESDELGLIFSFELPSGSYATVLMEEFMKSAPVVDDSELLAELA